jgi:8-oxo-dGTP pyrophosphatase MutT (NUDIX family)
MLNGTVTINVMKPPATNIPQRLKTHLARRAKQYITDDSRVPSAVLVPVLQREHCCDVLFSRRARGLTFHSGQISFPGGTRDAQDADLLDTALREAEEEIGLKRRDVTIIGELDDFITTTSNFVITPFVASIPWPYEFKVNPDEIEQLIYVPLLKLMDTNHQRQDTERFNDKEIPVTSYIHGDDIIWGATAHILSHLLDIIKVLPAKI